MSAKKELISFIENSPTPYHTVEESAKLLLKNGFSELIWGKEWEIKKGGAYFARLFDSALIAFRIGKKRGLRLAAAHTDSPTLRIKPHAEVKKEGYGVLNVEPYGGMLLSTWFDRPLSLAGKVVARGENAFSPQMYLFDYKKPLLTIPSLAIHMNREANEKNKINRQTDIMPLFTLLNEKIDKDFFAKMLSNKLKIKEKDLLSYDLMLYPAEKGCVFGYQEEMISSPRLDNLTSVKACIDGIIEAREADTTSLVALFDHEEVGSRTKQGAGSVILYQALETIYHALGRSASDLKEDIAEGFLLSVDVAHALHPNFTAKADITNRPVLGGGVVLKCAASQSYASDAMAVAVIKALCQDNNLDYQTFVNRSDIPGGSTLGSIASANLSIRALDIGVPILAMHSARETFAMKDQETLQKLIGVYFS